jgi:hypothetical protein
LPSLDEKVISRSYFFVSTLIYNLGNHWEAESNRREFFVDFAVTKGIDPLKAEDWYKVSAGSILAAKVVFSKIK